MNIDLNQAKKTASKMRGTIRVEVIRWGVYAHGAGTWVCIECQGKTCEKDPRKPVNCRWCGSTLQDGKGPR